MEAGRIDEMRVVTAFILGIAVIMCISCSGDKNGDEEIKTIVLSGEEGKTVFDILSANHEVEYTESEMGIFINAIDGIENSGGHFWVYSINAEPGKIACNQAVVSDGDKIEWKYK